MDAGLYNKAAHLFQQAIELPLSQREVFLSEECEGDDGLRAEVEDLLANHDEATILEKRKAYKLHKKLDSILVDEAGSASTLRTIVFSKKAQGIVWIVAFLFVSVLGYLIHLRTVAQLQDNESKDLRAVLDANAIGLSTWLTDYKRDVEMWSLNEEVIANSKRILLSTIEGKKEGAIFDTIAHLSLDRILSPVISKYDSSGYVLIDMTGAIVSNSQLDGLGIKLNDNGINTFYRALNGHTVVGKPGKSGYYVQPTKERHLMAGLIFGSLPRSKGTGK